VIATNLRGKFLVLAEAAEHIASGDRTIAFSTSNERKAGRPDAHKRDAQGPLRLRD